MKKKWIISVVSMSIMLFAMGCTSTPKWNDGTYEGEWT